ncbi:unnamed protein product [Enterobius vermicularis]|uniref:OAR domain-containing protein n=1 Tax=Enterobius vermicularis TaxID=51028 RepID=A0A0N4V8D2_ENTVE|nr:unnamed protein product [Enterobius vermicularis]
MNSIVSLASAASSGVKPFQDSEQIDTDSTTKESQLPMNLSSSPENVFDRRSDANNHLKSLNGASSAYSISKLLEKKVPSSSRASSSSASEDDNVLGDRCQSSDDEQSRSAENGDRDAPMVWPHLFAAGPSAFAVPQNCQLPDPTTFATALAAASSGSTDLSQAQHIQNAYLSYLLSSSLSAQTNSLRILGSQQENG